MTKSAYFRLSDAKGDTSTVTVYVPDATTYAQLEEFAQAFAELLDNVIGGKVAEVGFAASVVVSGLKAASLSIADVQEKARFLFRGVNNFLKSMGVPTFLESLMTPNSNVVDTADTAVAALVTAMTSGIAVTGGTIQPCDIRGDDLTSLESAFEDWGRSRG